MKIIVTGSAGFLGSNLANYLISKKYEVILIDKNQLNINNRKIKCIKADLLDIKSYEKYFKGADLVYHFAGISDIEYSKKHSSKTLEINILSTKNILDCCVKYKLKKIIFASTIYVNSLKGSFYRISKQACENLIIEYYYSNNLKFNILRFGTIYGPGSNITNTIYNILHQISRNNKVIIDGKGDEVREYIYVSDAVELAAKLTKNIYQNQNLTITGNHRYKLKELTGLINEIFNNKVKFIFNSAKKSHYKYTPYSLNEVNFSKKLIMQSHTDLGEGIINTYNHVIKEKEIS